MGGPLIPSTRERPPGVLGRGNFFLGQDFPSACKSRISRGCRLGPSLAASQPDGRRLLTRAAGPVGLPTCV